MVRLAVFLYSISLISGVFESSVLVSQLTIEEMRTAVKDPDYLTFAVLYDAGGDTSELVATIIETVAEEYRHFIRFIAIDCTEDYTACPSDIRPHLPALTAYIPQGTNPYTGQPWVKTEVYKGAISPRELSEFLLKHMPFLGIVFPSNEANEGFFDRNDRCKFVLFTKKPEISPLFKGVSSKYRNKADFAVVMKNQTEITRRFEVNSFPTILAIERSGEVQTYMGAPKFEELSGFVSRYVGSQRPSESPASPPPSPEPSKFPVTEVTEDNFSSSLSDTKQVVITHFHSGSPHPSWPHLTQLYSGIVHFIDVKCTLSFSKPYGVTKLPSLRLFPTNRKRKSLDISLDTLPSVLLKELKGSIETLTDHSINQFVDRMAEDRGIGCIYVSSDSLTLPIKALSSDPFFSEAFSFGYYNKGNKAILNALNVKRYPGLVCFVMLGEMDMRVMEFEGDLGSYEEIYRFLDEVVLGKLAPLVPPLPDREQEDVSEWTESSFTSQCLLKGGICVLAFFDGPIVTSTSEFQEKLQTRLRI